MAVVAAGVHLARHRRFVRDIAGLLDRQGIHVGTQSDDPATSSALAAADHAHHARAPDPGHHLVAAEALELVGNAGRRALHVVKEFGMGVDVAPPSGDLAMHGGNAVDDRHLLLLAAHPAELYTFNISRADALGQIKPAVA